MYLKFKEESLNRIYASYTINSYEHLMEELQNALRDYREKVEAIEMNPSDRKKILSLPFFLAKR